MTTSRRKHWSLLLPALLLCSVGLSAPEPGVQGGKSGDLVRNGGLEGLASGTLPAGWDTVVIGAPARFAVDPNEHHGGTQSVRLTASEVARAYLRSEPMEVAPGEKIRIAAWVRAREVPPDQGTVIVIADFASAAGAEMPAMKVGVANPASGDWQRIEGTVTAPDLAARLRVRLGFSYSHGTTWWDDVSVSPVEPLVARIELPSARLSPALEGLPVALLNRAGRRGPVTLRASLNGTASDTEAALSGEPVQKVRLPLKISRRGRAPLVLALREAGKEGSVFEEKRMVTVPPPLTLAPLLPTHWVREDGAPQLEAELDVDMPAEECRGATLRASLLDTNEKVRAAWAGAPAAPGHTRFSLRAPDLPEGSYRLAAELQPASGTPLRIEQPWAVIPRRLAEVTLNRGGYLVQDGKTIFPLGIFNGGARMAEAGEAGFTVSHAYNAVRVQAGQPPDDQRAKDFLDSTEKAGMRALFLVPLQYAFAGDWERFRHRIRLFRNHPALLAWDEEEGIARGDMKPEALRKMREILREEDPHHPFMVGDSRDLISRVTDRSNFFPLASMDLGMWWWYPIPLGPKPADALQGEELTRSRELAPPAFLTGRNTDKPLWVGVQSYKKPQTWARYPNAAEYRAQAYLALIHGAKGLMWYGGSVTGGLFLSPKEGDWEALKRLARELNGLTDVLIAPFAEAPKCLPEKAPVSVALKRAPDRHVLLAANRGPDPVEVTFRLGKPALESVPVLGESRTLAGAGQELKDRFAPYEVHVYELWRRADKRAGSE